MDFFPRRNLGGGRDHDSVLLKDEAGVGVARVVDHRRLEIHGRADLLLADLE